jgi:hypothetical protein
VHCLQRLLVKEKFLKHGARANGRFDAHTRDAVKAWATANKWANVSGSVDSAIRLAYGEVRDTRRRDACERPIDGLETDTTYAAQANDYATTSSGRLVNDCANGKNVDGLACVDVCVEHGETTQYCQTKCAPRGDADKKFACRAACQDAFAGACDRAFPPTSDKNRKKFEGCLEDMAAECARSCERWT